MNPAHLRGSVVKIIRNEPVALVVLNQIPRKGDRGKL